MKAKLLLFLPITSICLLSVSQYWNINIAFLFLIASGIYYWHMAKYIQNSKTKTISNGNLDNKTRNELIIASDGIRDSYHQMKKVISKLSDFSMYREILPDDLYTNLGSIHNRLKIMHEDLYENLVKIDSFLSKTKNPNSKERMHLIPMLTEDLVQIKIQQLQRSDIQINYIADLNDLSCFARVWSSKFKKSLSNIINNSVEAMPNGGVIDIKLYTKNKFIYIDIIDTGPGVQTKLFPQLTLAGFSHGKKAHKGEGLNYVSNYFSQWKGRLSFSSEENQGFKVTLCLPAQPAPPWYLDKIGIYSESKTIVIASEDRTYRNIWVQRFSGFNKGNLKIEQIDSQKSFVKWWNTNKGNMTKKDIILIENEWKKEKDQGIELCYKLGIQQRCIIVSQNYTDLLEAHSNFPFKLLPKSLSSRIAMESID